MNDCCNTMKMYVHTDQSELRTLTHKPHHWQHDHCWHQLIIIRDAWGQGNSVAQDGILFTCPGINSGAS